MYSDGRKRSDDEDENYRSSRGGSRRARSRSDSPERERRRDRSRSRERRTGRDDRHGSRRDEERGRGGRERDHRRSDEHRHDSEHSRDSSVVMLSRISKDTRKEDISRAIGGEISYVKEIRIIQREGYDSNYAFVEFYSSKDSMRWMDSHKDGITVRGRLLSVEYGHSRRGGEGRQRGEDRDWVCFKCDTMNFAWRRVCMTCDCSKSESEKLHEDVRQGRIACPEDSRRDNDDRNNPPCNVLIFRGLDALTTEDNVGEAVARLSSLPLKDLRLIRDKLTNTSRGFCFVELTSTEDATELLACIHKEYPAFFIGGRRITVNFARQNNPADVTVNKVASAAIEQAQWSMNPLNAGKSMKPIVHQRQRSKNTPQAYQQDPKPSRVEQPAQQTTVPAADGSQLPSTYSYDTTSGYYYDSATGLYYDPNTKYHYNSKTQQYCYFDSSSQSYIPVDNAGKPVATAATSTKGEGKKKKDSATAGASVSAKKIAKDMERWAKSVNAVKTSQQQQQQQQFQAFTKTEPSQPVGLPTLLATPSQPITLSATSSAPDIVQTGIALSAALKPEDEKPVLSTQAADVPEPADVPFVPDMNPAHTDWKQLACLLCKRKFGSREVLIKHQQFSDLHKQNLAKEKQQQSDEEMQYRDRAKERREKHGTPAIIPGWKKRLEREIHTEAPIAFEQPAHVKEGLKEDNIGNKLLQAMGWNEGQGLGKSNQGITQPIEASMRQASAGLGAPGSNYGSLYNSSGSYKDTLRSLTQARYHNQFN